MTFRHFLTPIPEPFLKDQATAEYFRQLHLWLDDISRPEGALATSEATTEVVLTQQEKLDQITITQDVNLDTTESQAQAATDALAVIQNALPDFNISNDGTQRTLNADAALIVAGAGYSQSDMQQLIDAFGVLSDYVATVTRDLKDKGIFSV